MSLIQRLLQSFSKSTTASAPHKTSPPSDAMPTVKFDPSRVTETVKVDLKNNIRLIEDIDPKHFDLVYDAAVRAISVGFDLGTLCDVLTGIDGVSKQRGAQIARTLSNKARSLIERERQAALGITHAVWVYSGAPCMSGRRASATQDAQRDADHRVANGKRYEISKGLFVSGNWTWPGVEDGCKCSSRAEIPGFSE